jgi:hypothetical protein
MTKYVEVATTQARPFVEALLILGAAGATIPAAFGSFKGAMLRTKVELPDNAKFEKTSCMRVTEVKSKEAVVSEPEKKSDEKYTKEQLEQMSLGELRKATGIAQGGKESIIKQYLGE